MWCMYEFFLKVQTLRFVFSIYSFLIDLDPCVINSLCVGVLSVWFSVHAPFCVLGVCGGQKRASGRNWTYRGLETTTRVVETEGRSSGRAASVLKHSPILYSPSYYC